MVFWPNTKINELLTKAASVSAAYSIDFISAKANEAKEQIFACFVGFHEFYVDKPMKVS